MGKVTKIPADVVSEIIEKTRIEQIIQRYTPLEQDGKNLRGNCPIHPDQDKSFKVLPHLQMYRCKGCGAMGNALVFLQEHDQLTMEEAARELADEAGIELLAEEEYKRQRKKQFKQDIYSALQDAAEFYHKILATIPECSASTRYLKKRGFKESTIKDLKIGFAQGNWDLILNQLSHKYSIKVLEAASLISQRRDKRGYYDYFRKRVMFPVFDMLGKVIGFGGRTIDPNDDIKYLNSREIPGIFEKRNALYLIDRARRESTRKGRLIMMEGYTDAALAHQIGLTNTFATAGTSITQAHALLLKKITDRIVICMDADSAGRKAAIDAAHLLLNTGINVELALLPDKKDPADMILEEQQNFQKRIDSAVSLFDFTLEDAIKKQKTSSTHNKVLVLKQLAPVLKAAPDVITLKTYLAKTAQELDLPYEIAAEAVDFTTGQPKPIPITPFLTTEHEYNIASLLLRKPAYRNEIGLRLLPEHFKNNEMRVLFAYFREAEQTKEDKISINYRLSQEPSLFDAQYAQDLPKELLYFAKKTGLPAEENKMYRLVSELQKTCAPEISASQAITNLLKAHYRHELKLMEEQIEDADIRGDIRNLEQLMQKYKQTYQEFSKLSFSRRD